MNNKIQEFHTGLFLDQKKQDELRLMDIVQDLLRKQYQLVAVLGPSLPNRTCEVLLQPLTLVTPDVNIANAQVLLQKYLSLIKESSPKMVFRKEPEVIDLEESDDEPMDQASVIVVDLDESDVSGKGQKSKETSSPNPALADSVIIVEDSLVKQNTSSKSPSPTFDSDDVLKNSQGNKEKSVSIQNLLNSDILVVDSVGKSSISESNNQRKKRKKPFKKDDIESIEIVEILDDDIIVLDDSFKTTNSSEPRKRLFEPDISVVEPTKVVNSVQTSLQSENQSDPVYAIASSSDVDNSSSNNILAGTTCTDPNQRSGDAQNITEGGENNHVDKSQSLGPPKKKSKLTYHRPAHLVTPLTQPTSGVSSTKADSDSNIYNPNAGTSEKRSGLRPIIIDGNNVAVGHGKGKFSLKGIQICINYFEKRGHRQIKVFIPQYRVNRDTFDQLHNMERQGLAVLTPSRKVNGKMVSSYDDRYIVQYAAEFGGVIVSSDNFRDLLSENPSWRDTIENRLLMFTWVDDLLMFPQDPLGRRGPSLEEFLKFPDT